MAKILTVDDSNLSRRALRSILEPAGHQVIEAADGLTAIEQYFLEKPDLVLLDLIMTGMLGYEVLVKIREIDAEARIIVATADLQRFTKAEVEAAGAKAVIHKPFKASIVLETVHAALQETAP